MDTLFLGIFRFCGSVYYLRQSPRSLPESLGRSRYHTGRQVNPWRDRAAPSLAEIRLEVLTAVEDAFNEHRVAHHHECDRRPPFKTDSP